jgi:glycosidase
VLYFLLPDRFSDGQETGFLDNDGRPVKYGTTPLYTPSDNGNAIRDASGTKAWLDAGAKFCGGNLRGVTTKLGYLKRLGITALWVGPIFKQVRKLETYHGYGVQNFLDIDPRFGTREDLRELVQTAHKLGIYVLLDIILNHSGNIFAYKAGSPKYSGREYEVAGYYDADRKPTIPMGTVDLEAYPNAFPDGAVWPAELQPAECFTRKGRIGDNSDHWDTAPECLDGDFYNLKDFSLGPDDPDHFTATPALEALCQVYKYWIAYADLDGFRIDTVKHMGDGPTRYFASVIHEFTQTLGKEKFLLIGEIAGNRAFETVEVTGIDAALGIGGIQEQLWKLPKGYSAPENYFSLFRNALYLKKGSHTWFRDKVVTMIDDHDQIWRSAGTKARFCSEGEGDKLILAAMALNLYTMGIPCVYYGSEQSFDGQGGSDGRGHFDDQYIREAMFGGGFGAFRSRGRHFFDEEKAVFKAHGEIAAIRQKEIALRRGRQYLRDISGDGTYFGYPVNEGGGKIRSLIAWSRIFDGVEILCAINTDADAEREAWVTVDDELHADGDNMDCLFPAGGKMVVIERSGDGRFVVNLKVGPAGFVIYKRTAG